MHQTFDTAKYRSDTVRIFGKLLKHCPTMGGPEENARFAGQYENTTSFYQAVFKSPRPREVWEALDERFSDSLFSCCNVCLYKLAKMIRYTKSIGGD